MPVKGPKFRMELNLINRMILSNSDWAPVNTYKTFQNTVEREIFKDKNSV